MVFFFFFFTWRAQDPLADHYGAETLGVCGCVGGGGHPSAWFTCSFSGQGELGWRLGGGGG